MSKELQGDSAHTPIDVDFAPATPHANNGLPNRLMTAFEVAEFVGCHEETVRQFVAHICAGC
jgi:hypothetical protein